MMQQRQPVDLGQILPIRMLQSAGDDATERLSRQFSVRREHPDVHVLVVKPKTSGRRRIPEFNRHGKLRPAPVGLNLPKGQVRKVEAITRLVEWPVPGGSGAR